MGWKPPKIGVNGFGISALNKKGYTSICLKKFRPRKEGHL
jgi:hypothetical protein